MAVEFRPFDTASFQKIMYPNGNVIDNIRLTTQGLPPNIGINPDNFHPTRGKYGDPGRYVWMVEPMVKVEPHSIIFVSRTGKIGFELLHDRFQDGLEADIYEAGRYHQGMLYPYSQASVGSKP